MTKVTELNKTESTAELLKTNKYRILLLTQDRFNDFFEFNKKIYPGLNNITNAKDRFFYHILNNPLIKDKSNPPIVVAYNTENEIIGQFLANPYEAYIGDKCQQVYYPYGFYVLKEYRKMGIGINLARLLAEISKLWIAADITPMAKNIDLSLGNIIGEIYNFVWFKNLFGPINAIGIPIFKDKWLLKSKAVQNVEFPKSLSLKNYSFNLVTSLSSWKDDPWDRNTLMFKRSRELLDWQFFKNPYKYHFYLLDNSKSNAYFVVRKYIYREMNFLEIVDYRISYNDKKSFAAILSAAKKLAKMLGFDGITTRSSHSFFDEELKKNFFIRNRTSEIVISNIKTDINSQILKERKKVFITKTDEMLGFIYDRAFEIN